MPSRRSHFTRAHSQEATSTHLSLKKQSNTTPRSFPFLHIVRLIVRALIWMWFLRNGMKFSARAAYATIAPAKSLLRGKKGPPLTLEHFLQRGRVLALWRDVVRAVNKAPPSTRQELLDFARGEFEQHRKVTDLGHIRYLISTGKTQLDSMARYVEQQAM
ncbi:hypothetical protein Q7P36_007981 [Cladosporium allicinum]